MNLPARSARLLVLSTLAAVALTGCGQTARPASGGAPSKPAAAGEHDHEAMARAGAQRVVSAMEAIELPPADPAGPDRQQKVVFDSADVKLVVIRLRNGAGLPVHASPFPVLIQALSGSGAVTAGDRRLPLDGAHLVALAANEAHAVVSDPGGDLVLLVQHLRGGH